MERLVRGLIQKRFKNRQSNGGRVRVLLFVSLEVKII